MIHYHRHVVETGLLGATGVPAVDEKIAEANEAIGRVWRAVIPREPLRQRAAASTVRWMRRVASFTGD
jgi:hypothetical protein